jgi:hypothetical protein
MPNGAPPNPALEAYKLEYQLAAGRYENIYKALWQIFSYLSAVTGALLTFGGDHFQQNFLWVLASLPLFFWYLSTYLPMNYYGDLCLMRLVAVETDINRESGADIKHYAHFSDNRSKGLRVRHIVHVFCIALGLILAVNGYKAIRACRSGVPLFREKSVETKPISLTADELKKLMEQSPPARQEPQEAKPARNISQTPAVPPKDAPTMKKTN